jgi:hypothetical protein
MPWKIRRLLWKVHDQFYDNVLVYFGYPPRIDGPRATSRHADEISLMSTSEMLTERNKNLAKRMQWEIQTMSPRGWVSADGRTIPKSDYPELWSAIKDGAGYADPWLDLGGIEFDFTITPTPHVFTLPQMVKLLEAMNVPYIDQVKRNLAPAALTQFDF